MDDLGVPPWFRKPPGIFTPIYDANGEDDWFPFKIVSHQLQLLVPKSMNETWISMGLSQPHGLWNYHGLLKFEWSWWFIMVFITIFPAKFATWGRMRNRPNQVSITRHFPPNFMGNKLGSHGKHRRMPRKLLWKWPGQVLSSCQKRTPEGMATSEQLGAVAKKQIFCVLGFDSAKKTETHGIRCPNFSTKTGSLYSVKMWRFLNG
jgi:hypothetical protein